MDSSVSFWVWGCVAAAMVGMAKTGVPGLGILVVPVIATIFPAKTSVGALLPLLLAGDVAAVLLFRRHANWPVMARLFPWTLAGVALAVVVLQRTTDDHLKPLLGIIVLVMLALEIARQRFGWLNVQHHGAFNASAGMLTGFATTVGNVAGPVMNLFLIGKGFDKKAFMGTVAWFFLVINAGKVPIFVHLGMITADTLRFDLKVLPALLAGGIAGRIILHHIPERAFQWLLMLMAGAAAIRLLM